VLQPETCVGTKLIWRLTSIMSKQVVRLMRVPRRFPALGEALDQVVPGDLCARLAMHPPLSASARTRQFRAAGRVNPVAILATRPLSMRIAFSRRGLGSGLRPWGEPLVRDGSGGLRLGT
jgi:hypothetical protein